MANEDEKRDPRRYLLEALHSNYMKSPMTSLIASKDRTDDFAALLREADLLRDEGLATGTLGPDMFTIRLTARGRTYVENGGHWSSPPPPPPREAAIRRLGIEGLHPAILAASSDLFTDTHYAEAILRACTAVEVRVRQLSGLSSMGEELMARAFSETIPLINVKHEPGASGASEQKGFKFLFMGLMTAIRNPKAHGLIQQTDPQRAIEHLAFASMLMRRLDDAEQLAQQTAAGEPSASNPAT